ncbi:conserved hypothetical protein [Vibrio chagasii]|nr:conserved hypothetical protein [Vibrio chagasii]
MRLTANQDFSVTKNAKGELDGYTAFYTSANPLKAKLEAKYFYVDGQCDYLRSEGFPKGSLAEDRVKGCKKKGRKINDPWLLPRFFSMEKGFYSLKDVYGDKYYPNNTTEERLTSIHKKLRNVPDKTQLKRWCESTICACMGAANCSMKQYVSMTKAEHEDYLLYLKYNAANHVLWFVGEQ